MTSSFRFKKCCVQKKQSSPSQTQASWRVAILFGHSIHEIADDIQAYINKDGVIRVQIGNKENNKHRNTYKHVHVNKKHQHNITSLPLSKTQRTHNLLTSNFCTPSFFYFLYSLKHYIPVQNPELPVLLFVQILSPLLARHSHNLYCDVHAQSKGHHRVTNDAVLEKKEKITLTTIKLQIYTIQ